MKRRARHVQKFKEGSSRQAARLVKDTQVSPADVKNVKKMLGL
jgi:ribosomal protein L35